MIHAKKTLLIALLVALLVVTWLMVMSGKPRMQAKQNQLIEQAETYLTDEVYVTALPLLHEAADISANRTAEARQKLVSSYLALGERKSATGQLEILVADKKADEAVFLQLAELYFDSGKFRQGISTLQQGMTTVESATLVEAYNANVFRYLPYSTRYDSIGGNYCGRLVASLNGKQGYLAPSNSVSIGMLFDKATDFDSGKAMVIDNGQAAIINTNGQRLALCKEQVEDIAPLVGGIGAVKIGGAWYYVDVDFGRATDAYEYIGRLSAGYRAVQQGGKWYLQDSSRKNVTPAFDGIKLDSDGNAVGQGRAFARQGDSYILIDTSGKQIGTESYEDAYPFIDGAAAVRQGGKWLFISTEGVPTLTGDFVAAKSFSCELAPVQQGDKWGYIDSNGIVRIPIELDDATPLRDGAAAVMRNASWQLIQLRIYKD